MAITSLRPSRCARTIALGLAMAAWLGTATAQQPATPLGSASAALRGAISGPAWKDLSTSQQRALAPLAANWGKLSEPHRRKWLALAANFDKIGPAEQAKLHSRMTEWVALSPQQRTQARLNFGEVQLQQVSSEERKAKWEAYLALTPEERQQFAAGALAKPPATAAAVKPVPAQKLVTMPPRRPDDAKPARIVAVPPGEAAEPAH